MEDDTESVMMSRPVFDVFSISIHPTEALDDDNPLCDGEACRIYGTVQVCDEYENVYYVYNRKEDDPDTVRLGGDITLAGFPVICCRALTVSVYIYDMSHQVEICNGSFSLDYTAPDYPYDDLRYSKVEGRYGFFANVHHATFLHAAVADVTEVQITKQDGGASGGLFGSVVACLVRAADEEEEYVSTLLFDNGPAKFDARVQLYRTCVAVPAFCTLKIQVNFDGENGVRIRKDVVKHQYSWGTFTESVPDQNCGITLNVQWPYCYEGFPNAKETQGQVSAKEIFTNNLEFIDMETTCLCGIYRRQFTSPLHMSSFVQVFSVLVFSDDNDLDIVGTVKLIGSEGESVPIFEGSDKLSKQRRTLALQCPPSILEITEKRFQVVVGLNDGKGGGVVGEGTCLWRDASIDYYYSDKHLSTVFKGDNAYTVVHYSMFQRSSKATIVVSFIPATTRGVVGGLCVCGSITAEYGSYEYPTPYDEEHYKYRIFSRSEDDCCELLQVGPGSGSNLELSKSLMAVPAEDTLVLNVDLKVGVVDQKFQGLKQVVEFEPYKGNIYAVERGDYTLAIWVEWHGCNYSKPITYPKFSDMRSLRKVMPKIP